MSDVTKVVDAVTNPVTEPLTSRRPNMAGFIIGGFAAPVIDAAAVNIAGRTGTPYLNNPLAVGFAELAAAYAISRYTTKGEYVGMAKTGVEVGAAVAGARNIVIFGTNFINTRRAAKSPKTQNNTIRGF